MSATSLIAISLFATTTKGLSIPEGTCVTQWDCQQNPWTSPYPICERNQCQCLNGSCFVYTRSGSGYLFYCGTCGTLGSECNSTIECDVEKCSNDNFCHCRRGEVYNELCVIYEPIPTTITSVVLIIILIALLIFLKLFKSRNKIKQYCFNRCSDTNSDQSTVIGFNPNSHQKSAAYTITNSDFMVTSNDSELEWALELSRRMPTVWEDGMSLDYPTWSSAASSNRHHGASRSPINYPISERLEDVPEAGPSGFHRDQRALALRTRSTLSSSSSGTSSYRQRTRMSSSSVSSRTSSSSTTTRRSTTHSVQESTRSIRSRVNSQSIALTSSGSSRDSSRSSSVSTGGSSRGSSSSSSGSTRGSRVGSSRSSSDSSRGSSGTPTIPDKDSILPSESET